MNFTDVPLMNYTDGVVVSPSSTTILSNDEAVHHTNEQSEDIFAVLYQAMVYLLLLYVAGDLFCGKVLKVIPPLVGQIAIGMFLGPHGISFLSSDTLWPLLGQIGLVLLLCQAGLEMDFNILRQIGPRGGLMALIGTTSPTSIGFLLAFFVLKLPFESALAVGCSFGATSASIALNVLHPCGVLQTPVGQLVVAIAVFDDMIALVVLSQLQALTADTFSVSAIVIPIVSAFLWCFVGGAAALFVMPMILRHLTDIEQRMCSKSHYAKQNMEITNQESDVNDEKDEMMYVNDSFGILDNIQMTHIIVLLFVLLPATHYSGTSPLLGAFLTGICACQQNNASHMYNHELNKIIQWLMRIFFGASIAFVVPVHLFGDLQVIARGFLLSLSLLGKIMTGSLLTPIHLDEKEDNSNRQQIQRHRRRRFDRHHLRNCFIVGFSMAGEAEFAMLVAGFGFKEGLVEEDVYASIVFAILLSTILSPCLLRLTLTFFQVDTGVGFQAIAMPELNEGEVIDSDKSDVSQLT